LSALIAAGQNSSSASSSHARSDHSGDESNAEDDESNDDDDDDDSGSLAAEMQAALRRGESKTNDDSSKMSKEDDEDDEEEERVFEVGDKCHGHFQEEDNWYAANVMAVHRDDSTGEVTYDIKYMGFDESEAYEYRKPSDQIASPEEFETGSSVGSSIGRDSLGGEEEDEEEDGSSDYVEKFKESSEHKQNEKNKAIAAKAESSTEDKDEREEEEEEGEDVEDDDDEPRVFEVGDKCHGLFVEENNWYKASVMAVHRHSKTGSITYDIKYDGFDETEAYDNGKPPSDVLPPEEFESGTEDSDEHEDAAALDAVNEEGDDDLAQLLAEFGLGDELYDPLLEAAGGSSAEHVVQLGAPALAKLGVSLLKARKLVKAAEVLVSERSTTSSGRGGSSSSSQGTRSRSVSPRK